MTRQETPFDEGVRGEVESMGTSRLEAGSHRSWPNKDNIDFTTTILQGGGPIGAACLLVKEKGLGVFTFELLKSLSILRDIRCFACLSHFCADRRLFWRLLADLTPKHLTSSQNAVRVPIRNVS